jgi:hypothetical protein
MGLKLDGSKDISSGLYHFTKETENWYREYNWCNFLVKMADNYQDSPDFIDRISYLLSSNEPIMVLEKQVADFFPCTNIILRNLFKAEFPGFAQLVNNDMIPLLIIEFVLRCSFPPEIGGQLCKLVKDNGYTIIYFNDDSHNKKLAVLQAEKKIPFCGEGTFADLLMFVHDYFYDYR